MATHEKKSAKEAILAERSKGGKYSMQSMQANMSTGGGEPIDAGKKWTTERRVLQPRDPDTGQFGYNSDAGLGRKYPARGGKADPVGYKRWMLSQGVVKKGDVKNIAESTWIAIDSINYDELKDYFSNFDETTREFFGSKDSSALSSKFIKKRGRQSKAESEGISKGKGQLGTYNLQNASASILNEIKNKINSPKVVNLGINSAGIAKNANLAKNIAYNQTVANAPAPAPKIPSAITKAAPKQNTAGVSSNAPSAQPAAPAKSVLVGGANEAKSDPKKFYSDNKEVFDMIAQAVSEGGASVTGEEIVQKYIDGDITDADINGLFE